MKYALIILVRNEIEGITKIFDQIPLNRFDEVLAIDGMSSDGSVEFLEKKGIKVITQIVNGRGQAFRDAFNNTVSDILVFYGPDGNENPLDIVQFIQEFDNNKSAGMVVARRLGPKAVNKEDFKIFKPRKWVNVVFNMMANLFWNKDSYVYDTINGFRAITRETWNTIKIDADGYTVEYQSTIRCFKQNIQIVEFPTNELQRIGKKKGSPAFHTGVIFIKLFLHEIFLSLAAIFTTKYNTPTN
jgi:glycosyltransferase involved in cell wall biosynthesis